MNAQILCDAIRAVRMAAAPEATPQRPALCGLTVIATPDALDLIAADGYVLAMARLDPIGATWRGVLPLGGVRAAATLLEGADEATIHRISDRSLAIATPIGRLVLPALDVTVPSYEAVIAKADGLPLRDALTVSELCGLPPHPTRTYMDEPIVEVAGVCCQRRLIVNITRALPSELKLAVHGREGSPLYLAGIAHPWRGYVMPLSLGRRAA